MSIFYICGKPGAGKSYLAVKQIIEELKDPNSKRFVVTNIVLKLPEIALWLHQNCKHEVNLTERVRILDDSETAEFWLYEPGRVFDKRSVISRRQREYDVPDFSQRGEPGTLYVIDEVHNYFGARDWAQTGNDCTWFLSQHRKLLCDVVMVTQHPEQTDKALRRLAQEYMSVRNLSREPVFGFNLASWFGAFRYNRTLNSPQSPNPGSFDTGFVELKPEVYGKFYDTMAGVGIAGRVVPPTNAKRGRSLWWLGVPVFGFFYVVYLVLTHVSQINAAITNAFSHLIYHRPYSALVGCTNVVGVAGSVGPAVPSILGVPISGLPGTPSARSSRKPDTDVAFDSDHVRPPLVRPLGSSPLDTNDVFCIGYCVLLDETRVYLSDGSTAYSELGEVERVSPGHVRVFGREYRVVVGSDVLRSSLSSVVSRARAPESTVGNSDAPLDTVSQAVTGEVSPDTVSTVVVTPAIHGQAYGVETPHLNGFSGMQRNGGIQN